MERVRGDKLVKIVVLVLSIVLAVNIAVLAWIMIYNRFFDRANASASVSGNLITPETDVSLEGEFGYGEQLNESTAAADSFNIYNTESDIEDTGVAFLALDDSQSSEPVIDEEQKKDAPVLSLYKKHASDNDPFHVINMFPGDAETMYYCVKVSYSERITVNFRAEIHDGYEKLAEVMMIRVTLLTTGKVMYDGRMVDMPQALSHELTSDVATTDELYYEITAYLDTSVGNEYQNKELVADFKWWVEDTEHLEPAPPTGDVSPMLIAALVFLSLLSLIVIFIIVKRRRADEAYE